MQHRKRLSYLIRGRNEVEPADVFVRAELIRQELELIRREMGKPKSRGLAVTALSRLDVVDRPVAVSGQFISSNPGQRQYYLHL